MITHPLRNIYEQLMVGVAAIADPDPPAKPIKKAAASSALGELALTVVAGQTQLRDIIEQGFARLVGQGSPLLIHLSGFTVPYQSFENLRAALGEMECVVKPIDKLLNVHSIDGTLKYRLQNQVFTFFFRSFTEAISFFSAEQCAFNQLNTPNRDSVLSFVARVMLPFNAGSDAWDALEAAGCRLVEVPLEIDLGFVPESEAFAGAAKICANRSFFCLKRSFVNGMEVHVGVLVGDPSERDPAVAEKNKMLTISGKLKMFGQLLTLPATILEYKNLPTIRVKAGKCIDTWESPLTSAVVKVRVLNIVRSSGVVLL